MVRLDTSLLLTPVEAYGISGRSKMFASTHLSSAAAGINRDRRHGHGRAA